MRGTPTARYFDREVVLAVTRKRSLCRAILALKA